MAAAPEAVHDYYRRAAFLATVFKRQVITVSAPTVTTDSTTTTTSSSSTSSSTSSSSTTSSSSQTSQTSRSTPSTRNTPTTVDQTTEATVTSDVSSTISSQYVTTNSSGQVVTTTLVIIPTSSTSTTTDSSASSTPVGAIVGGVVGGIAAIALVGLVIYLIRRKTRRNEFEANLFDPDRNVDRPTSAGVGPRFDLGGAGGGATAAAGAGGMAAVGNASHVTPYSYGPASTGPTSNQGSSVLGQPEMQQAPNTGYYPDPYGQNQYSQYPTPSQYPTNSVGVGEHFPNPYAPGYNPAAAMAGGALGAGMVAHGVSRGQTTSPASSGYPQSSPLFSGQSHEGISQTTSPPPTLAPTGAYAAQNPRSAKEREAFARTNNQYSVSNQRNSSPTPSANRSSVVGSSVVGSSAVGPTSLVRVHQDGGRVQDEDEGGHEDAEIPPTYDSIPRGH